MLHPPQKKKACQIESDPTNRSPSRGYFFSLLPIPSKPGARNFHRGTDNTPVTPDERSAQIDVSIDPRHPRGNPKKNNLKPKLTAVSFKHIEDMEKKILQKENGFPTTIFQGRTVKLSLSYKSLWWMCRGVGRKREFIYWGSIASCLFIIPILGVLLKFTGSQIMKVNKGPLPK